MRRRAPPRIAVAAMIRATPCLKRGQDNLRPLLLTKMNEVLNLG